MQKPGDDDDSEELDNLLSDQYISLGRARELLDGFASVCDLETKILQDYSADTENASPGDEPDKT